MSARVLTDSRKRPAKALAEAIWNALRDKNIAIPYHQVDLHLDEPVLRALGVRAA